MLITLILLSQLNPLQQVEKERNTLIVNAVSRVASSVVSIAVVSTLVERRSLFDDPFFGEFWGFFLPPFYLEREVHSLGSGFFIDSHGHILTNAHVVKDAKRIIVTTIEGESYSAKVVGLSEKFDIAVIKIDKQNTPVPPIGNSDNLLIGEWVIALGNPFGFLLEDPQPTVTVGVISATKRSIKGYGTERYYRNLIQTDAAINPGNSGGPLANILGEVIGVNTFILSKSGGSEGIGFAIPINTALKIAQEIIKNSVVREGYLGIKIQDLTEELKEGLGFYGKGVLVTSVDPEGPCRGKLKEGDIILEVNGYKIRNVRDYEDFFYTLLPEEKISLKIWQSGKVFDVFIVSEEFKFDEIEVGFGLKATDLTWKVRERMNISSNRGVLITSVDRGSFFERIGLRAGDVLLEINKRSIRNTSDLRDLLKNLKPGYISITFERKGRTYWATGLLRF